MSLQNHPRDWNSTVDVEKRIGKRAPDGQPWCRGYSWSAPAWVPSELEFEKVVGHSIWYEEQYPYDDDLKHKTEYIVCPDGRAIRRHRIDGDLCEEEILEKGSWLIDYWWPTYACRAGVRILSV